MIDFRWRHALTILVALTALVFFQYRQTLFYLLDVWRDVVEGEYAHGYLVLMIAAYLVWINRARLRRSPPCPRFRLLPLLAAGVGLWVLAGIVDVQVAQAAGLWLVVGALGWLVMGDRVAAILFFPFVYVLFAIPVWSPLSQVLQDLTAEVVFHVARLINIPAYRQDNLIVLASGSLSIEEACSGLRYLLAMLTLSSLYAYLNYRRLHARLLVVGVASLAAVLSNLIRVFVVVYIGYTSEMQDPIVNDHLMLGWYIFSAIVFLLLIVDVRLSRHFVAAADKPPCSSSVDRLAQPCHRSRAALLAGGVCALALLLAGPAVLDTVLTQNRQAMARQQDEAWQLRLVNDIGHWHSVETAVDDRWRPLFAGARTARRDYLDDNGGEAGAQAPVTLFVAYYAAQEQGVELINELNAVTNRKIWKTRYARGRRLARGTLEVLEQRVTNGKMERLIWYRYQVDGRALTNRYLAKLLQAWAVLKGRPEAAAMVASVPVRGDIGHARQRLTDFFEAVDTASATRPLYRMKKTGNADAGAPYSDGRLP